MPDDLGKWDKVMDREKLRRRQEQTAIAAWLKEKASRETQSDRRRKAALDIILSEEYD